MEVEDPTPQLQQTGQVRQPDQFGQTNESSSSQGGSPPDSPVSQLQAAQDSQDSQDSQENAYQPYIAFPPSDYMDNLETLAMQLKFCEIKAQLDVYENNLNVLIYVVDYSHQSLLTLNVLLYIQKLFQTKNIGSRSRKAKVFNWFSKWAAINSQRQMMDTQCQFARTVATFLKYQWPQNEIHVFLQGIQQMMDVSIWMNILSVKILQNAVDMAQQGRTSFERQLMKRGLNQILGMGLSAFATCVLPKRTLQSCFVFAFDTSIVIEIGCASLKLVKDCICYDFFKTKNEQSGNYFLQERSPLLIPTKYDIRYVDFSHFNLLKEETLMSELKFHFDALNHKRVKILIIQIMGDCMRIQPRFFSPNFKDDRVYIKCINMYLNTLMQMGKQLPLETSDDFEIALAYGESLNKSLCTFSIHKISPAILKSIVTEEFQFLLNNLLSKGLVSYKLMHLHFTFFEKLANFRNLRSNDLRSSLQRYYKIIKNKFVNLTLDLFDARKNNSLVADTKIPEISIEMLENPLLDEYLLDQCLQLLAMCPQDQFHEFTDNFDIKILSCYCRFYTLSALYQDNKASNDKEELLCEMLQLTDGSLVNIQLYKHEEETVKKLRLLLVYMVKRLISIPTISGYRQQYDQMLRQVLQVRHIQYSVVIGLVRLVYQHGMECESIKQEMMEYIRMQDADRLEQDLDISVQIYAIVCPLQDLQVFLDNTTCDRLLKCLACLTGIYEAKQFQKFMVVMQWFVATCQPDYREILAKQDPNSVEVAVQVTDILLYALKIDSRCDYKLNYSVFTRLLCPLFANCVSILNKTQSAEQCFNHDHCLRSLVTIAIRFVLLGKAYLQIRTSPEFALVRSSVPKILETVGRLKTKEDLERGKTQLMELIQLELQTTDNLLDQPCISDIIVKLLPDSLPLANDFMNNPNTLDQPKLLLFRRVVSTTVGRSLGLEQWKLYLALYAKQSRLAEILQSTDAYSKYFDTVDKLHNIKFKACRQIQQIEETIANIPLDRHD